MASTSALRLDLSFPDAASSSPSAAHAFSVPRREEWPISYDDINENVVDDDDDDGWGMGSGELPPKDAVQARKWLTAMTVWRAASWDSLAGSSAQTGDVTARPLRHRSSVSSLRSNRSHRLDVDESFEADSSVYHANTHPSTPRKPRLGGTPGARVAIGTAQGSVWIFAQSRRNATNHTNVPIIQTPPEGTKPSEFSTARSPSPSPSIGSQSSRSTRHGGPGRESISLLPPFAGFASGQQHHQHGQSIDTNSSTVILTSPTQGTTEPTSVSNVSPTAWKASSSSSSSLATSSALESRLEAQYHTGQNRESALGGVMEVLGLSKHHHHHHTHGSSSSLRSPEQSGHGTPALIGETSAKAAMPPPEGRRHVHNRASAITNTPFPPPEPTLVNTNTRSRKASAESSHATSRRESVAMSAQPSTDRPTTGIDSGPVSDECGPLEIVTPMVQIRPRDASAIASLQVVEVGNDKDQVLLVLQRSGLLTAWSQSDGTLLADIHLGRSDAYSFAKSADAVPVPSSSNNALAGLSTPISALAALRSHTNSPALSAGAGTPSGTQTPRRDKDVGSEENHQPYSFAASFQSMDVLPAQDEVYLACYDKCKRRFAFVNLRPAPASKVELRTVAASVCSEGTRFPTVSVRTDVPGDTVTAQVGSYEEGSKSFVVQGINLKAPLPAAFAPKSPRLPVSNVNSSTSKTLPLPDGIGTPIKGVVSIWADTLLVWSQHQLSIVRIGDAELTEASRLDIDHIECVQVHDGESRDTRWAVLSTSRGLEQLEVIADEGHRNVALALSSLDDSGRWTSASLTSLEGHSNSPLTVAARVSNGSLSLSVLTSSSIGESAARQHRIFASMSSTASPNNGIKALLPLTMEKIAALLEDDNLVYTSLSQLVSGDLPKTRLPNAPGIEAQVTALTLLVNPRTQVKYIFAGYASGDVVFWDATTLHLVAQWSLFTVPITSVHAFGNDDSTLRLSGCVTVVGQDGTVATVLLDGLKLLSLIPGRGAPLERIAVRADDVLLLYGDERARVWDMASQELRRSIGIDQALGLLQDEAGAWSEYHLLGSDGAASTSPTVGILSAISPRSDSCASIAADFRKAIDAAAKAADGSAPSRTATVRGASQLLEKGESFDGNKTLPLPRPQAGRPSTPTGPVRVHSILKPILSALWPWHLDSTKDEILCSMLNLKVPTTAVTLGLSFGGHRIQMTSSAQSKQYASLRCSGSSSAAQLLIVSSMLHVLSRLEDSKDVAHNLLDWIVNDLPAAARPDCQEPSLPTLALHLVDTSADVQAACRMLFTAQVRRLSARQTDSLSSSWSPSLPGPLRSTSKTNPHPPSSPSSLSYDARNASQALALLGFLSLECYTSMDPNVLRDVATGVISSIEDSDNVTGQMVALHLCIGGFSVWQQYIDAMQLLRLVSTLAMQQEEGSSLSKEKQSVIALARRTTLHIAEENTPLFMTTLHLDILQASTANSAAATMRLVAFIVRRKPLILYPNLPRLAEAVVKSLDPTSPMREAVLQSATMMISELIATYPSIGFHNKLQRLAIGTHEGAAILYDLKTATRLFILEGHKAKVDGLSFSPDGRRLITMSLSEGRILIWKIGSSLAGFFAPGSMPRQGGTDPSGAYKSVTFAPPHMSLTEHHHPHGRGSGQEGLPNIDIEWRGEKDVKVDVADVSMSFNVA